MNATGKVHFNVARFIGYTTSVVLILAGGAILLGFSGVVFIEPHFEHTARIIKGAALLSMMIGICIDICLRTKIDDLHERSQGDPKIALWLCWAIMAFAVYLIVSGAWGNYMT